MLYVPGDKARAIDKIRGLPVDGVIFDLEDAVAPENKELARRTIAEAVNAGGFGNRELLLRVNGIGTDDDFMLANTLALDGVVVPKVSSPETVLTAAEKTPHAVWCMIETPMGVLRAAEIAAASDRVGGFLAGTNDLNKELRARHVPSRMPLLTSLSMIILAARAHGIAAIDGVHLDLDDAEGFDASCRHGVELGFDGKTLIHPNSVEAANRIFGPSADEIAHARTLVAAWDEARAQGLGVARIGGSMVEQLHVDEANRLLALAEAIAHR